MLVANTPSHRLHHSPLQLREVEIEQGRFYVKLNSKGPIAQQEIEGHLMEKISAKVKAPECGQRALNQRALQHLRQRQTARTSTACPYLTWGSSGEKQAVSHHRIAISASRKMASAVWALPNFSGTA